MARCLLVLAVAGCNQIYGLDGTRLPPDAAVFPVTGQILHRWVEGADAPVVKEAPLNTTNVVYLSVRTDGGLQEIAVGADGRFTFHRDADNAPYRLELTVDGDIFEVHGSAPDVRFVVRSAGRLDPEPTEDRLIVRFGQAAGTDQGAVASTGIWSYSETQPFAGGFDVNWQAPTRTAGRHGLVDSSKGDVLYTLDYDGLTSVDGKPYRGLTGAERHSIKMLGMSSPITFQPPPRIPTPLPCRLVGAITKDIMRLKAALPSPYTFLSDSWSVSAIASLDIGVVGHAELASAAFALGDIAITPRIHNPIVGSKLIGSTGVAYRRYVKHPSAASGYFIDAAIVHSTPLDCAVQNVLIPDAPLGVPKGFRIDGVPLTDNLDVTPAGDNLELTWDLDVAGSIDVYNIVLVEVLNEPVFDSTSARVTRVYQTPEPRLTIDVSTLVRGRYYILQLTGFRGIPDAKNGDLGRLTYPFSGVQVYTSLFRVR